MSSLIVHYDPMQLSQLREASKRDRQASHFEKSPPRYTRPSAKPKAVPVNFERQNKLFLMEQQLRNRQNGVKLVREAVKEVKSDFFMRERNSSTAKISTVEELSLPSPRKVASHAAAAQRFVVLDNSASLSNTVCLEASLNRSGIVPEYIERRKDAISTKQTEALINQQVAIAETEFPSGTEPLSPSRVDRTRDFFEGRVADLTSKIAKFSFARESTLLGKQKKTLLEDQLRQAEEQMLIFSSLLSLLPHTTRSRRQRRIRLRSGHDRCIFK